MAAAALLAVACAPGSSPVASSSSGAAGSAPAGNASGAPTDLGGVTLNNNSFGGNYGDAWKKYVVAPFEQKFNAKINVTDALTGDIVAKVIAQKDNPQFDVVQGAEPGIAKLAGMGLVEVLDPAKIPNMANLLPGSVVDGNYINYDFSLDAMAYNTNKVTTAPTKWLDLWKPEYAGHVLIGASNTCCALTFIIELNNELGADYHETVEPAFEKLKELKPSLLTTYTAHDQATTLLSSGDAWIAAWSGDRSYAAELAGNPVKTVYPASGSVTGPDAIAIVKGTKNLAAAEAYVNWVLEKEQLVNLETYGINVPSRTDALEALPPEAKNGMPTVDQLKNAINLDLDFVAAHSSEWLERFDKEVASN
jgi:putative spermidine/putrescine transport system substrate-binding protein